MSAGFDVVTTCEGLAWAPFSGVVSNEIYPEYQILVAHSRRLPDETLLFPGHLYAPEPSSSIGEQKQTNYALRAPDKATFMALVTEGQPPAPEYFVYDAILNRKDRELLDEAFATRPREEWVEQLKKSPGDFIFTIVNSIDDLPSDPQVQANDYVVDFDHPRICDSDTILKLQETPKSLTIYGAGVIGQVYATFLHRGGHDVSILARGRRLAWIVTDARYGGVG